MKRKAKKFKQSGVSTQQMAASLGCSVKTLLKLREGKMFSQGRSKHYWIVNPHAARVTYRWNQEKCLSLLDQLEKANQP